MDLRSRMSALLNRGSQALSRPNSTNWADLPLSSGAVAESRAALAVSDRLPPWMSDLPVYHPAGYRNFVRYGYLGNELIYAGINQIIKVFAQAQLQVEDDNETVLARHPLRQLIRRPSGTDLLERKRSYEYALWEWTLMDMFLAGNCFWEKVRSATGKVVRIQRLEPDRVGIIPSEKDYIDHYVYEVGGQWWPIPEANVLHWKFHNPGLGNPFDEYFGVAPMIAAWRSLQTDNSMTDFTKVVLQNYAIPGAVIESDQVVDDPTAKEIKRRYREAAGGKNRGDVFVTQKGMKVKTIGMNLQELSFEGLRAISETRLLMVLGGAPLVYLLGTSAGMKRAIYNNYSEAREALADDVVGPLWNRIDDAITAWLLPEFDTDDSHFAHFDTSSVIAFEERRLRRHEVATKSLMSGLLLRDEARALVRYSPVGRDGRDALYIPINLDVVEVGADGMVDDPEPAGDLEDDPADAPSATDKGKPPAVPPKKKTAATPDSKTPKETQP